MKKRFGSKRILFDLKLFWTQKLLAPKSFLGSTKFGSKIILSPKNVGFKKVWVKQDVGPKYCLPNILSKLGQ